jgi:hypothetical protein
VRSIVVDPPATTVTDLSIGDVNAYGLAHDSVAVYWRTDTAIRRADAASGQPTTLVSGVSPARCDVVAYQGSVYYVLADGSLWSKTGAAQPVLVAVTPDAGADVRGLAVSADGLFWSDFAHGRIWRYRP